MAASHRSLRFTNPGVPPTMSHGGLATPRTVICRLLHAPATNRGRSAGCQPAGRPYAVAGCPVRPNPRLVMGDMTLGDADTGPVAIQGFPAGTESEVAVSPEGCGRPYNSCRTGGRHARVGNLRDPGSRNVDQVVLGRASGRDRRIAQACNGAPRGRCAEVKCRCRHGSSR
jgi:hypothetical protein